MDNLSLEGAGIAFGDHADALLIHADGSYAAPGVAVDLSQLAPGLRVGGHFRVECVDRLGRTRWVNDLKNGVSNAALDDLLNVYLRDQTQTSAWYIGLVDNSGFSAFAAGDTSASHGGWTEFQGFSNATRGAWAPGASSGQSVANGTSVDFNINTAGTIRGLFLSSSNAKGGTTGLLFSTAAFSGGNQSVNNGDTLKVTYTVSAASN